MISGDKIIWTDSAVEDIANALEERKNFLDALSDKNSLDDEESAGIDVGDELLISDSDPKTEEFTEILGVKSPWPLTLSPITNGTFGTYYTAADGTGLVSVIVSFTDIPGATDYEIRFSKVVD